MKNTIHILVGLPGSGKTYFAKNFVMENPNIHFISEDEIKKKQLYSSSNITYEIELELKRCFSRNSKPDILIKCLKKGTTLVTLVMSKCLIFLN